MNHGSLFSGIGGFDLAAEWMGWTNKFHCEWNEFGQRVLKYYWPNALSYEDITKTDFTIWRGRIDVLTGGFPCQPYSMAGKRLGKEDERHLWPEMLRAIREIQPTWVVGENVLGLVNWNGGLVFDEVQADLEAQGYEVQPYVLPACAVNAPHKRDRVWFVAFNDSNTNSAGLQKERTEQQAARASRSGSQWITSDTSSKRCDDGSDNREELQVQNDDGTATQSESERFGRKCWASEARATHARIATSNAEGEPSQRVRPEQREPGEQEQGQPGGTRSQVGDGEHASNTERIGGGEVLHHIQREQSDGAISYTSHEQTNWQEFPTVSPVCNGDDGIPSELDGVTFSKWRAESVKAGGNAIVPQVAHQIFKAIQQYKNEH